MCFSVERNKVFKVKTQIIHKKQIQSEAWVFIHACRDYRNLYHLAQHDRTSVNVNLHCFVYDIAVLTLTWLTPSGEDIIEEEEITSSIWGIKFTNEK